MPTSIASPRPLDAAAGPAEEYVAFGNMESRNGLQARVEIPLMLRALALPRGARILEVGCGRGVALPEFARRLVPAALVGVDIDPALVALARRRVAQHGVAATVVEGDVRDLPFETGRFDLVVDFGTCYHAADSLAGRRAALREVARVLRKGGLFVHETRVAQRLAHPVRSRGRSLRWEGAPTLVAHRSAVLWAVRRQVGSARD